LPGPYRAEAPWSDGISPCPAAAQGKSAGAGRGGLGPCR
jgi:hypothetical protein